MQHLTKSPSMPFLAHLRFFMLGIFIFAMFSLILHQGPLWGQTVSPDPVVQKNLSLISEITGYQASLSPVEGSFYDDQYKVYLSEPSRTPVIRSQSGISQKSVQSVIQNGNILLIPESTGDWIMAFDATTGNLIDANFISLSGLGTPIHAILGPNNNILVSDQINDVVYEYDLDGNYVGVFAPAGGANTTILDNIRGIALRPNGNLLVTVGAGTNFDAVAEFNTSGTYVGNFITNGSGGLDSPFDVYQRNGADWLVGGINSDAIHRYDLNTGAYIANLASINTFPEQIYEMGNGNVLVGNFSGTQEGVVEYTSAGALVGVYNPVSLGGYRGVYELPNGNILTTTGTGVYEIDRLGNIVSTKISGVSARFIEYIPSGTSLNLKKSVGLDPSVCSADDMIVVAPGTEVTYCFEITNNTGVTLSYHTLVDSHLGVILSDFPYSLADGASAFITHTFTVNETTLNTATWTGFNEARDVQFSGVATAQVIVSTVALPLSNLAILLSMIFIAGFLVVYFIRRF